MVEDIELAILGRELEIVGGSRHN